MANVYFHYSHSRGVLIDRSGADVDDLVQVHEQAHSIARALVMMLSSEDWLDWVLCGRRPHCKNNLTFGYGRVQVMCPACLRGNYDRWP